MYYSRFRHLAIERQQSPPEASEIEAIEALLGASLPDSFRAFLDVANGGSLEYVIDVPLGGGGTESMSFGGLFSTRNGTFCDETFLGEIRSERERTKIPLGVLPFARDGGDSMVYLDLSSTGKGRVVAFVRGLPEWAGLRTDSVFVELARSFDEYVSKLHLDRADVIRSLAEDVKTGDHVDATEEWLDIGMPGWKEDAELSTAVGAARRRVVLG